MCPISLWPMSRPPSRSQSPTGIGTCPAFLCVCSMLSKARMSTEDSPFTSSPHRARCSCPIHCWRQNGAGFGLKASGRRRYFHLGYFSRKGFTQRKRICLSVLPLSHSLCDSWMNWSAKDKESLSHDEDMGPNSTTYASISRGMTRDLFIG